MKNKKSEKKFALPKGKRLMAMLLSLVLLGASIGVTIAYLSDKGNTITNTFIPAEVRINIEEKNTDKVKKDVVIRNVKTDKTIDVYIRAKIVVTWQDADGNILGKAPVEGTDYEISINTTHWTLKDGFYYYNKGKVAPGDCTTNLINTANVKNGANVPEGYFLCIDVLASGAQAAGKDSSGKTAVEALWGEAAAIAVGAKSGS